LEGTKYLGSIQRKFFASQPVSALAGGRDEAGPAAGFGGTRAGGKSRESDGGGQLLSGRTIKLNTKGWCGFRARSKLRLSPGSSCQFIQKEGKKGKVGCVGFWFIPVDLGSFWFGAG
jgi:hypothetical protein